MTATTDFDRLLGSALEADGPQGLPPGLVDAAVAQVQTLSQRRPLMPVVDRLGWPPIGWPIPRAASHRFALVTMVALLGAAVVASALLIAGGQPRSLLDDGERIYVWANSQAHLVTADGVSSHTVPSFRGDGTECAPLVPGTMIASRVGYGKWHLIDMTTGRAVGSISTDYGGGERWSSRGETLALFDFTGRVGFVTFADPSAPVTRWIPVPGVVDVAWSLDGDRLAAVAIRDGAIGVVVIDTSTDAASTVATTLRGEGASIGWASNGSLVDVRVVAEVAGGFTMDSTLVDTRSGLSISLPDTPISNGSDVVPGDGALSPDGMRFAAPVNASVDVFRQNGEIEWAISTVRPARDLSWASDGRRLAFRDGDRLVVADVDDGTQVGMTLAATDPFKWHPTGDDLIVARQIEDGALVERYRSQDLERLAWNNLPGPTRIRRPSEPALPLCLQLDDDVPSS